MPRRVGALTRAEGLDELFGLGSRREPMRGELDTVATCKRGLRQQFDFALIEISSREELGDNFPDFRAFHDVLGVNPHDGGVVEVRVCGFAWGSTQAWSRGCSREAAWGAKSDLRGNFL